MKYKVIIHAFYPGQVLKPLKFQVNGSISVERIFEVARSKLPQDDPQRLRVVNIEEIKI